jgi:dolichol-phosphate mannosyltransferase
MTNSQAHSSCVSIIVPTLNEEENIEPLVSQIIVCGVPFREILFVDDRSTDGTREKICAVAGDQPIRLIEQNAADLGLAGAIMSGARAAEGESLLVMDATSHPPERINDLLTPLFAGAADMVVGSRYVEADRRRDGTSGAGSIASRCHACVPLTGLHDSMCGFCNPPFTTTEVGAAHQRFQNCVRDNAARRRDVAST